MSIQNPLENYGLERIRMEEDDRYVWVYYAGKVENVVNKLTKENAELNAKLKAIVTTDNSAVIERLSNENERLVKCCKEYDSRQRIDERIKFNGAQQLRSMKRALWLARADRAYTEWGHWATIWFCDTQAVLNINKSSISQDPYRCTIQRNAAIWRNMWYEVERKCRAKAEEYK